MELTTDTNTRRLLYRCLEAALWTSTREARKAASAMTALAAGDDFTVPAPGMDPKVALQLADLIKQRGITPELVDALVQDLRRIPPDAVAVKPIELNADAVDAILTAYDRILADPQVDGPLVRGGAAATLLPIIDLLKRGR